MSLFNIFNVAGSAMTGQSNSSLTVIVANGSNSI